MPEHAIASLEIPNPFFEGRNRIYVILADPITLIDTGIATDRAYQALVDGIEELGIAIRDIGRVILTHKHIDHIGNAWRIQQESNAEIFIHESEMPSVSDVDPKGQRFRTLVHQRLIEWGAPEEALPKPEENSGLHWELESATPTGLVDGETLEFEDGSLEVLHTPGHTNGSICLKYGRHLLTGDHVLPDISPNVGGGDMRQNGLLRKYLQSLSRIAEMDSEIDEAYPGHGAPFSHFADRCKELIDHHDQRLDKTIEFLRQSGPLSAFEMAKQLFGDMQDFHVVLGCAEAQAHLEFLVEEKQVTCESGRYSVLS